MEDNKVDYEKLMNTLLEKRQSICDSSDLRECAEMEYKEVLDKHWDIKAEVMQEELQLADIVTELHNFDMASTSEYYEDLSEKLAEMSKRSIQLDIERETIIEDAAKDIKEIIEKYDEMDTFYAPENMERLTAEIVEQQKIYMESIEKQTKELEMLERQLENNLEMPNLKDIFDDDFKAKYNEESMECLQKKLDNLSRAFFELNKKLEEFE